MSNLLRLGCCLLLLPLPASAQRLDAVATARRLNRAAAARLVSSDTAGAADSLLAAARAWPRQGAYLLAAARYAAFAGRTDTALALLGEANRMGFAWLPTHPAFARLETLPAFRTLASGSEANQVPVANSAVFRTLPDPWLHPEGVAFDPRSGRVFVSGVRQRKVVVIETDGRVRDFVPTSVGLDAVLGLVVDTARNLLWLTSAQTPEQEGPPSGVAGGSVLVAASLSDGEIVERWTLPDTPGGHLLGDVLLAPDGTVYTTDSRSPHIYRVDRPGKGGVLTKTPWESRDWQSLQGLAFAPDGRTAWVADWGTGLFRIDVSTGNVTPVDSDPSIFTLGVDGLYSVGENRLVALQNGIAPARVVAFELDATGTRVERLELLDRHLPRAIEPTLGVLVPGGLLYVANSPWGLYGANGAVDPEKPFPAPVLLRLPLKAEKLKS
jgi:sugar lactone lactonase YvrE